MNFIMLLAGISSYEDEDSDGENSSSIMVKIVLVTWLCPWHISLIKQQRDGKGPREHQKIKKTFNYINKASKRTQKVNIPVST